MKKMDLEIVKEVKLLDQVIAVMDFLEALGYDNTKLTAQDVVVLKSDLIKTIESAEKL